MWPQLEAGFCFIHSELEHGGTTGLGQAETGRPSLLYALDCQLLVTNCPKVGRT